jgi:hypothetical protein
MTNDQLHEFIGRFNALSAAVMRAKRGCTGQEAVNGWQDNRDLARDMLVALGCETKEVK